MGIRRLSVSADRSFTTVSIHDTAIGPDADMDAFCRDRSLISALDLKAAEAGKPWDAAAKFHVRSLTEFELHFVLSLGHEENRGLGMVDTDRNGPYSLWAFRLGCAGWDGVYREPRGDEGEDPVPVKWAASASNSHKSVTAESLGALPAEVVQDIGGLILDLSMIGEQEKKASGSQPATPPNSISTASTATSSEAPEMSSEPAPMKIIAS